MDEHSYEPSPLDVIFDLTAHRMLWLWLAEHPGKTKSDWPEWKCNGGKFDDNTDSECFACQACNEMAGLPEFDTGEGYRAVQSCIKFCPLQWPGKTCVAQRSERDERGIYAVWSRYSLKARSYAYVKHFEQQKYYEECASKLARQIAALTVKESWKGQVI